MKLDMTTLGAPLDEVGDDAAGAEAGGFDGWFTGETSHEPLLSCVAAGAATRRIDVGTAIAVAFPRSPMHVAYAAHDLQALTRGRFVLGLGSQVKAHIEKRFAAVWSQPAERMREFVLALRAIWSTWQTGQRLAFRGEFYRHTLMSPFFSPEDHGFGPPRVWLAAVGPRMTEIAGEVTDGLLCHGFTTDRYLTEVTIPRLLDGARRAGKQRGDLEVSLPVFVVTGRDDEEVAAVDDMVRGQIAFYGSTPAYRPVLELHGWQELHEQLHAASLRGDWAAMAGMIDDDVLHTFAVVAPPDEVGSLIRQRYAGVVDRVTLYTSFRFEGESLERLLADVHG